MLNSDFPLPRFFLPVSTNDLGIELHVTIQVPLFRCPLNIIMNRLSARVEPWPIRVRVEWKCLKVRDNSFPWMPDLHKYEMGHHTEPLGTY